MTGSSVLFWRRHIEGTRTRRRLVAAALVLTSVAAVVPNGTAHALSPAIGHLDTIGSIEPRNGTLAIYGWALTADYPTVSLGVRILIDGAVYPMPSPGWIIANTYRPDVGAAYPGYGNYHGFAHVVSVPFGTHTICAQAQNSGVYSNLNNCFSYTMTLDTMYASSNQSAGCSDSGMFDGGWLACQTDNAGLYVCFESSASTKLRSGIDTTLSYTYNTTDLNVYEESCVYSGSGETDIVYRQLTSLPGSSLAFVHCNDATSNLKCDQHYATFKTAWVNDSATTSDRVWKTACHETGHAVGLLHGANSTAVPDTDSSVPGISNTSASLQCMKSGYANLDPWLGANNANHINATY